MSRKVNNIAKNSELYTEAAKNKPTEFTSRIQGLATLSCNNFNREDFDMEKSLNTTKNSFKALENPKGIQDMLIAQMLSIHNLQQKSAALANESKHHPTKKYFTNSAVKLSNCFTQQASLLAKLQGALGHRIVVEHVEVHEGGQAVVGNINPGNTTKPMETKENENELL